MKPPFLAIDWGTTNRRIYRIGADGRAEISARDDKGILAFARGDFPAEVASIRARFGDLPVMCAGMIGSNRGWAEAPYISCPAGLEALAGDLLWIEAGRTAIVPGMTIDDGARRDVMRGEEVQLLGATAAGLAPPDALLCQPGTHCKWAWMADGQIARFVTAMTGELFALVRQHSLLAPQLIGEVAANGSFTDGVRDAGTGDLAAKLFGVRADLVSGANTIADPASYVSGLLIGSDVLHRDVAGTVVHILADPVLGGLYATAIERAGGHAALIDSHDAFVHGIARIWELIA